jgi:GNAT superfamily N-acetyltransferase
VVAMIEICEAPTEAERAAILKPLLEFNRCAVGDAGHSRVAILLRDDKTSEVTGGLWASVFYNWLYVELLCVPEAARGSGIGTALLATAESIAIARNCVGVWLDTYEFQAPAFYEKLGYEVFARLPQYPTGYERFFLKKMVDNAATGYSGAKAR